MKSTQRYAVLSAAITAALVGGVVPSLANDTVLTVDTSKAKETNKAEQQQNELNLAVNQLLTKGKSDVAVPVETKAVADETTAITETADDTTTSTNKTAVDNNGFYVKNSDNTYNSLTDKGLWVGGTDADTGFRVDTDGNVKTSGTVTAESVNAQNSLVVGSTDGTIANAAFSVDGSGNVTTLGTINGLTFEPNAIWTDHYGFQDPVDMINGVGFGNAAYGRDGVIFAKDAVINSFQNSGMTGGYVYLADGSAEKNNGASTAIGGGSSIWGDNSVAIGFGANVEMNMEPPEVAEGEDPYTGYQGTAIGAWSKVDAQNGTALGFQAEARQANGVALGSESVVMEDDVNAVSVGHKKGDTYLGGAMLYDDDLFRRITNVAAGVNPEDVVTVGQLKDNKDIATSGIAKWDEASNGASMNGVLNGVTLKDGEVTAESVNAQNGLVVGSTDGTIANAAFSVDGSGNVTTNGQINGFELTPNVEWTDHYNFTDTVNTINGVGFGLVGSINEGTLYAKSIVVDDFEKAGINAGYVYAVDGSSETNIGASTALGGGSSIWGGNSIALGFAAEVGMNPNVADELANDPDYLGYQGTAVGAWSKVNGQNGVALGYQAEVNQANGVALGSESVVEEGDMNTVSVGHKAGTTYAGFTYDDDLFRRITNVAAGVNPEDVVTVGQLKDNKDIATSGIAKWDEASNGASMNGVLNGVTLKDGEVTATNINTTGTINGMTFQHDVDWQTPFMFWADKVDTINGVGFGTGDGEGTLYAKDLQVDTFFKAGLVNGHVYDLDGYSEPTKNYGSVAIGPSSSVAGGDSVAIGQNASVQADPSHELWGSDYRGYQGVALGYNATVNATSGVALGPNTNVFGENSVALGANSFVGEGDFDVISVGHQKGDYDGWSEYEDDLFRRITNVATGVAPHDAVTVGQLQDLDDEATVGLAKWDQKVVGEGETAKTVSIVGQLNGVTLKDGDITANNISVKTINGKTVASADDVDAIIGHSASQLGTFTLANGGKSLVDGINSNTALINKNSDSITKITDGLKTAFDGIDVDKLKSDYSKDATATTKVATAKAFAAPASYSLSLASAVPTSAVLAADDRPTPGNGSGSGDVTRPQPGEFDGITTTGDATINGNATVGKDLSVAGSATIGKDLTVSGTSNLNGDVNVGKNLTVTGTTELKGDTKVDGKLTIKDGDKTMDVANAINSNKDAITSQGQAISTLGQGLTSLGKEVDSVGAISAALAGLHPLDYNGNSKFQLSAAVGTYDGTQAMAFGGFYHANPNVLLSLGASTSFGGERKTAGNFGVTFRVGSGVSESPTTADNAALQSKVQEQQEQLTAQQKQIDELKAMVQQLAAK